MVPRAAAATARLLWAACRPSPDAAAVVAAVDDGADLALAARVALAQRVGPLLWAGLCDAGVAQRLGTAADMLRYEFACRRAQAPMLLPMAVAAAVEPLTRAGLEPVLFKGPTLVARYPHPGLRPMDDIDVLLPVGYDAGVAALQEAGWEVWPGPAGAPYDTVLHHPRVPDLPLDLHRGLDSWRERPNGLSAMDLWQHRRPLGCYGTAVWSLPPEEELVALAAHAGKPYHQFQRLIWSVDLAVVVQSAGRALDRDRVALVARRVGCVTVMAVGLRHARRLGAEVPDELLAWPSSRSRSAALAPVIAETWPVDVYEKAARRGLRYALADSRRRQILLAAGDVTERGVLGFREARPGWSPRASGVVAIGGTARRTSTRGRAGTYRTYGHNREETGGRSWATAS